MGAENKISLLTQLISEEESTLGFQLRQNLKGSNLDTTKLASFLKWLKWQRAWKSARHYSHLPIDAPEELPMSWGSQ